MKFWSYLQNLSPIVPEPDIPNMLADIKLKHPLQKMLYNNRQNTMHRIKYQTRNIVSDKKKLLN